MSENTPPPDTTSENNQAYRLGEAVFKPSRWPGLIWAVPVAALAIIIWLGIGALMNSGPSVTVELPIAGGLKAGTTKVKYQGFQVGQVSSVTLLKSLGQMKVGIDLDPVMQGHLGPGTKYWVAGASFSLTDMSSIKALIGGPYIGIDPRPGATVHHATGLSMPPVLQSPADGETLTLLSDKLSNISPGAPVFYKGYNVGEIRGVHMQPDGKSFEIYAFIKAKRENLINSNTRFWDAGAVRVSTGGSGPGIELQSVPALVTGAVAFETPDSPPGTPVKSGARFPLYGSEDAAHAAPGPSAVPYAVVFPGGPHGLAAGAGVQLEGSPAGQVTKVTMQYDPAQGSVRTIVELVLDPEQIGLAGQTWRLTDPAPQMNAMLNTLIGHGLRAEMGSAIPVVGGKIIQLELIKGQPPAALTPGTPPQIPSFGGGGGVGQIITQVNDILATVNAMPLDQIAANVHQATRRLAQLSNAPKTKRTLERLDRTVAHVDDMTRQVDAQLPQIMDQLKSSLTQAQEALRQVKGLTSPDGAANAGPDSASLPQAMYELTQAARSLRALTDYLTSHPNALITGRGD